MNKADTIQVIHTLKAAKKDDLVINGKPNYWLNYFLLNNDKETFSGMHTLTPETNLKEINSMWKQNRIYIPVSCLDKSIKLIQNLEN